MTAREPHPLRCEMCEYHDCASMMKHPHHCDHPMYRDMDNPDMLSFVTNEEYGRIKWMGCASHSAASRPYPAPDCKKYLDYRADSGHLYHLVYDLLGREIAPEELGDALFEIREEWAAARKAREEEREKVLKEITEHLEMFRIQTGDCPMLNHIDFEGDCVDFLKQELVESLRQQDEGG